MIPQARVEALGIKNKPNHKNFDLLFGVNRQIWNKDKKVSVPFGGNKIHDQSFYKFGRIFGFEVTRHIEYRDGILYYYEGDKDEKYLGYCVLENTYVTFYKTKQGHHLMYLSNGFQGAEVIFPQNSYLNKLPPDFYKHIIQLNFNENYSVFDMIGRGSFAKVYTGVCNDTNRMVAIKIIPKVDEKGEENRTIVNEEKKVLVRMDSPYLVKMLQFYENQSDFIFVMQYLPGTDLMSYLNSVADLKLSQGIKIITKVLRGLQAIHQRNIIHRDLKPENIMINQQNYSVKIIDFGLSLILHENMPKNKYKRCGTMGFIAHEVISSNPLNRRAYDGRCDVFSLGLIAYLILVGYNPLKGKNYHETLKLNTECNIKIDKESIIQNYEKQCLQFFEGVLAKQPSQRWSAEKALASKFLNMEHPQIVLDRENSLHKDLLSPEQQSYHLVSPLTPKPREKNFFS